MKSSLENSPQELSLRTPLENSLEELSSSPLLENSFQELSFSSDHQELACAPKDPP